MVDSRERFRRALNLLNDAVGHAFSGAVLLVARGGEVVLEVGVGRTAYPGFGAQPHPVTPETIFDLASLTKPLALAALAMRLCGQGRLWLDAPISLFVPEAKNSWLCDVSLRLLLAHASGLPAWRPYGQKIVEQTGLEKAGSALARSLMLKSILEEQQEYVPGAKVIYSDLGYVLLGFALERVCKTRLDTLFGRLIARPLGLKRTFFVRVLRGEVVARPVALVEFAATEICPLRRRLLHGEVHDENAFVLGGVAGHAGLFGCAREVFRIVMAMADSRSEIFERRYFEEFASEVVPGSNRTLAFDLPSPEASSAGSRHPEGLLGHLGFTGTSFWFQPETKTIVVLLTNRVHPSRANDIRTFRPLLHDAVWDSLN